ncbi:hypothetical protein GCM10010145_20250 [Streptomyces ruber]|uniref:Uncharacterized protein n=2 Tax=Streptomyces TaxID=1883 RepID=A0A918BAV6_9ACTN|nr:hypothetical protein GCM10010145_20250 [Streptomyces ruber]
MLPAFQQRADLLGRFEDRLVAVAGQLVLVFVHAMPVELCGAHAERGQIRLIRARAQNCVVRVLRHYETPFAETDGGRMVMRVW